MAVLWCGAMVEELQVLAPQGCPSDGSFPTGSSTGAVQDGAQDLPETGGYCHPLPSCLFQQHGPCWLLAQQLPICLHSPAGITVSLTAVTFEKSKAPCRDQFCRCKGLGLAAAPTPSARSIPSGEA